MKDYYSILGVPRNASKEQIRNTYRNLAKRFHPDRNPGRNDIEEKFKEITEAYNVLSDEKAKHKYDLKRAYKENRKADPSSGSGRKSDANNQGFGKQKTDNRQRKEQPRKKTEAEIKKDKRFTWFVYGTLLFFVALVSVMIATGPVESDEEKAVKEMLIQKNMQENLNYQRNKALEKKIYSADSPYDRYFGEGTILEETNNSVIVVNSNTHDVVACLMEEGGGSRTIRNEFLGAGESYRMNGIPNGTYYIKAYFGTEWDPEKILIKDKIKGGFKNEAGYFKSDDKKNLLIIQQKRSGDNLLYSAYEVYLINLVSDSTKRITAEEFFR